MTRHRGRFAPSPTGRMHLGNVRSALLGWLWARAEGGEFWLRIEDLDRARCRPEHTDALREDLDYLSLHTDGPTIFQSERGEAYQAALAQLATQGRLYPCVCTRAEVARAASAPHAGEEGPVYPGTCRGLSADALSARGQGRPAALRFVPFEGVTRIDDLVHGPYEQDVAREVGDFVVRRNDGVASYQLAVVVDDAHSGVTHVLRGEDLLSSTPRQLHLYRALGKPPPLSAHVPLVLTPDGKRLAKREGAFALTELRQAGVPAERVLGLLGRWSGVGDGSPVTAAELAAQFTLASVPRAPVVTTEAAIREALGL